MTSSQTFSSPALLLVNRYHIAFWPLNRYPHLCFEYLLFKGLGNLVWRLFRDLDIAKVVLVFRIVSDDEILHKHYYYV